MTSIIRVATAVNRVIPADSKACLAALWQSVEVALDDTPDIILFPCLSLSGASCGSFFASGSVLDDCKVALEQLCLMSAELECWLVVGLPLEDAGRGASVMAVLYGGVVRGFVPAFDPPKELDITGFSAQILPVDTVFCSGSLSFAVLAGDVDGLPRRMHLLANTGCDLVLVPSCQPATGGSFARGREIARAVSRDYGIAVAVANAGVGEVASPHLYRGWCGLWECGAELALAQCQTAECRAIGDFDTDIIRSQKRVTGWQEAKFCAYSGMKDGLLRPVVREPFLAGLGRAELLEICSLQAHSLAARLHGSGMTRLLLGVSGGLDSTLALLVSARALELLNLPSQNLIGVTMPGFGTTGRTYRNAVALIETLGVGKREVPIRDACQQHYRDINLPQDDRGLAYENSQARERTQILMDMGDMTNALVVGTGDLSEAALGWCTFGGDHLAGYSINACLTKGMVRAVCAALADEYPKETADLLRDVLDTPVSPELLPPGEGGETLQRTEDILGPYELHDFFLWYLIRYNMRLSKIYNYACIAFAGKYRADYIKDRLMFFTRRFCRSQYKRSCQTDSAAILYPNLGLGGYQFPADIGPQALLAQLAQDSGEQETGV